MDARQVSNASTAIRRSDITPAGERAMDGVIGKRGKERAPSDADVRRAERSPALIGMARGML